MASTTDTHRNTSKDEEYREPSTLNISKIVQNYEKMFAHRFTVEDEEYQIYVQRPADPPPLVEDWRSRLGGNQRYRDRFRDKRQYDQQGGYRSNQWQEKGWGNNYSQHSHGQISYPQHGRLPQDGYSSYSQGPPHGYY